MRNNPGEFLKRTSLAGLSYSLLGIGSLGMIAGINGCSGKGESDISRPNIIYILADDLGYGELGSYGQTRIETPYLDQLAADGMIFTDHYTGSPVCAPARCILLTGIHSGQAQIRGNDPVRERGSGIYDYHAVIADPALEGQRPIKAGTVTIGSLLQSAGYKTALVGKWGLGTPGSDGLPNKQGFDFFYGYVCQRQAHTFYPVHLWKNDQKVYLNNDTIAPHDWLPADADPYDLRSYEPYSLNDYSSTLMFEEITRFVDENAGRPFFLYWADPIPHLPLQAPQRWIDHYVDKFGDEEPYVGREGSGGYFPARYPRATYAAMISYLDENIGKLIQQLKDLDLYENTLIIFTSDNGPTGSYTPWFESAAPFRTGSGYNKGHLNEGGIRVPMIATWPRVIEPGSKTGHISAFYDVMPTINEITGINNPENISGTSFLPTLKGEKQDQPEFLYWEFPESGGQMAVRMGNFKALRKNMHQGNLKWDLFNLDEDPEERNDISGKHPDIITRVESIVARERTASPYERFRFRVLGE
jgi:arylsulfatase A-like enzyme